MLTSLSVTGGPAGGVPVAVAVLVYWPAVAMREAVKVQVSVDVEQAVGVGVAADEGRVEVVGRVGGRAVVVAHRHPGEGHVAGVGHQVGEGHRGAHPGHRTDRAADILPDVFARIKGASEALVRAGTENQAWFRLGS